MNIYVYVFYTDHTLRNGDMCVANCLLNCNGKKVRGLFNVEKKYYYLETTIGSHYT